jgi:hypothetical protein
MSTEAQIVAGCCSGKVLVVPGSNHCFHIRYPKWNFSCSSSVSPSKCRSKSSYCNMTPGGRNSGVKRRQPFLGSDSVTTFRGNEYSNNNRGIVRKRCFLLGLPRGYITRTVGQPSWWLRNPESYFFLKLAVQLWRKDLQECGYEENTLCVL